MFQSRNCGSEEFDCVDGEISEQTTIFRYLGSTDKGYLSFDGSSTGLLGRRVVFPTNASEFGPYIRSAVRTSDDITGQFKITLASKAILRLRVDG